MICTTKGKLYREPGLDFEKPMPSWEELLAL